MPSQEYFQELQVLESNLQNLLLQKQAFQMELSETESALREVKKSEGDVYKIAGQFLIKSNQKTILENLEKKQKIFQLRIEAIEKQESSINEKIDDLKEQFSKKKSKSKN